MDNNSKKPNNKVNMPKFNLNWLYMIIAMMLLGLYLTNESGTATKNISYDEFQQYVRDGYISKVIGYDDNSVEAYVKPQHVGNVFRQDSSRVGKNPLITTEAPSRESLGNSCKRKETTPTLTAPLTTKKAELLRCHFVADSPLCIPYRFLDFHVPPHERWWRHGRRWRHLQRRKVQGPIV